MASDEDVPPLEDMSDLIKQVDALRELKKTKQPNVATSLQNGHGDASRPVPKPISNPTIDTKTTKTSASTSKVGSKSTDSQSVKPVKESNNSTAKISNSEVTVKQKSADGFGGMKKGFLFGGPSKPKASAVAVKTSTTTQPKQTLEDIPFVRKNENAKSENFRFSEVQEAMAKTNEQLMQNKEWVTDDLLTKLEKNEKLAKRLQDPTFIQAISDFQKNPQEAVVKYGQNMEVQEFFTEFCGLMGDHFTKLEGGPSTAAPNPPTTPSVQTNPQPTGADMSVRSSTNPKQATSQDEAKMQEILSDPDIRLILMDPKIQELFECLRNNPENAQRILNTAAGELKGKIQKLVQVGLLQFQS